MALRPQKINGQRIGTDFLQEEILANMPIEKRSTPNQRNGSKNKQRNNFMTIKIMQI